MQWEGRVSFQQKIVLCWGTTLELDFHIDCSYPKNSPSFEVYTFRPISLCNFSNKIWTKLLNASLSKILPSIISTNQSAFVKGRLLHDNVLLAQEIIQYLPKKVREGNIALEINIAKACDRIRKFGFADAWIDRIWSCISNCQFPVLVNGLACGYFQSSRE